MANLFKSLKPDVKVTKNGFDLSRKHVFSSQAGFALPCLAVETVPNDHFEISLQGLLRTQTFNRPAFLRGKQRFDFFFVPYSQLWHPFNQFINQRKDAHSTNQKGFLYCPTVSLGDIMRTIIYSNHSEFPDVPKYDMMNYRFAPLMVRVLDMLGYGDYRWLLDEDTTLNDLEEMAHYYDSKYVNVFRLAAYQHIWYDYYRNKYWDEPDSVTGGILPTASFDYVRAFNFDDIDCSSLGNSRISGNDLYIRLQNMCTLRYCQWKQDLFTSSLPSQQFGAVSSVDLSFNSADFVPSGSAESVRMRYFFAKAENSDIVATSSSSNATGYTGTWNIPSAFDVLSLRKAEALQAWKQATLRAGNMVDDAWKAHFGTTPYYEGDENVLFLGSFDGRLDINTVETTANSSVGGNNKVGDLAATGNAVISGNSIKFDCRDYGVIMCISSFVPEAEYISDALDKANTLYEQFDFFTPEFQNIGLEAVPQYLTKIGGLNINRWNSILGYSPRYYMYKTAWDKVFGEFHSCESVEGANQDTLSVGGTLTPWVAPRTITLGQLNVRPLGQFYVSPKVFNNVFAIAATAKQTSDYFVHNVYFDIKAIRPMSVLGLPQF